MAGVKGKSGGKRAGAGVKRKPPAEAMKPFVEVDKSGEKSVDGLAITSDPLEFLLHVMQGKIDANAGQIRSAIAAAQYVHMKKGDGGVKDAKKDAAKKAASGKFAPSAPPRLVAANGKPVH